MRFLPYSTCACWPTVCLRLSTLFNKRPVLTWQQYVIAGRIIKEASSGKIHRVQVIGCLLPMRLKITIYGGAYSALWGWCCNHVSSLQSWCRATCSWESSRRKFRCFSWKQLRRLPSKSHVLVSWLSNGQWTCLVSMLGIVDCPFCANTQYRFSSPCPWKRWVLLVHGTTAALAPSNDQVKKVVSWHVTVGICQVPLFQFLEDEGMIVAVKSGHINLGLEAATAICSVGLDMILLIHQILQSCGPCDCWWSGYRCY